MLPSLTRIYGITGNDIEDMPVEEVEAYVADLREIAKVRKQQQDEARKRAAKRRR